MEEGSRGVGGGLETYIFWVVDNTCVEAKLHARAHHSSHY